MEKILRRFGWFVCLVLVQVLIFNKICWFGLATPFVYIYFLLALDQDVSRCHLLLLGFALGLCIDVFSNMWGINAASCVLLAFSRPWLLRMFTSHEEYESFEPSMAVMGKWAFVCYVLCAVFLHHTMLFLLESFSFVHIGYLLLRILCSLLFTSLFIIFLDLIRHHQ